MACIALVELRRRNNVRSRDATAKLIQADLSMFTNPQSARDVLDAMIDAGHRYSNLEKHLGQGVAFVLGKTVSETS